MIQFQIRPKFNAFVMVAVAGFPAAACAQATYLSAFQGSYLGNGNGAFAASDFHSGANDASNPFVTSQTYSGLDSHGNAQTMTIAGDAYSSASYGKIHIFAEGTVTNPYYNAANTPYFDGTGNPDPAGSPDLIGLHGNAGWGDQLTYSGLGGGSYYVNYFFRLEGSVSGDTEAGLNFTTTDPGAPSYNPRTKQGNELWVTPDYPVTWGVPVGINVDFYAGLTTYASQRPEGVTLSGRADYANTLTLVGISVKDANGNAVSGWTVSSASGAVYPQAVPEPSAWLTMSAGLGVLVGGRRLRRTR